MDHSSLDDTDLCSVKEPVHHSRVLASISGNAQIFESDVKGCFDYGKNVHNGKQKRSDSPRPSPLPVLGSNDRSDSCDRLAARKAKRSSLLNQERHYLQTEQYKIYKERKRQDIGSDGKPVWPDHIEESFQNGKHYQHCFSFAII